MIACLESGPLLGLAKLSSERVNLEDGDCPEIGTKVSDILIDCHAMLSINLVVR